MNKEKVQKGVKEHQEIMNGAYDKWKEKTSMKEWLFELTGLEKKAVALGKLNQQVCNGGFVQWCDNGYAKDTIDILQNIQLGIESKCQIYPLIEKVIKMAQEADYLYSEYNNSLKYMDGDDADIEYEDMSESLDKFDSSYYAISEDEILKEMNSYLERCQK